MMEQKAQEADGSRKVRPDFIWMFSRHSYYLPNVRPGDNRWGLAAGEDPAGTGGGMRMYMNRKNVWTFALVWYFSFAFVPLGLLLMVKAYTAGIVGALAVYLLANGCRQMKTEEEQAGWEIRQMHRWLIYWCFSGLGFLGMATGVMTDNRLWCWGMAGACILFALLFWWWADRRYLWPSVEEKERDWMDLCPLMRTAFMVIQTVALDSALYWPWPAKLLFVIELGVGILVCAGMEALIRCEKRNGVWNRRQMVKWTGGYLVVSLLAAVVLVFCYWQP